MKFVWHAVPFSISQDPYVCESNIVPNLGRPAGEQPGNAFFLWKASGNQAMNHDRSGIFKNSWEFFQGLVTVPFWVYWTSPYSSQIGPYN